MAETQELVETLKPNAFIGFIDKLFDPALALLDDIGGTALLFGQSLTWLVRPPLRIAQLLNAIEFIGAGSLFIAGLVGMFTGMAFTLSSIIGFRQFGAEGMVGGVVALALARELAPVLAAVVVTARAGSTMASELGNLRVTEQIDAITTMGVSPIQYLVVPRIVATLVTLPLLALAFGIAGMFGAYVVGVLWQGIDPGVFFERIEQFIKWNDIRMLLVKSAIFGVIVSTICCKKGFHASGGARGVGEATAKAVVASIVAIFGADYVVTSFMTEL
ncbi:MAG TPA: ABC transporter permease [Labilithrix sp.]|nr:ABC transporter permease [Labilithrix sp.]